MKKFILPALGAALAVGMPQVAADEVQLSQLMIIGQPGQTGNANRTLPSGSAGIAPFNLPAASPYATSSVPGAIQPSPFIGERGDLNNAEREVVAPAERDEGGRLRPSVDRTQARFSGERDADGKLLPTYLPQRAQATPAPQTTPSAPPPTQMQREQPPASQPGTMQQRRQPSGQAQPGMTGTGQQPSGQAQPGMTGTGQSNQSPSQMQREQPAQTGTTQQRRQPSGQAQPGMTGSGQTDRTMQKGQMQKSGSQMQSKSGQAGRGMNQQEMSETAALNALSAEGYTNFGKIERVGNNWQTTATKGGKQVNVQIDPQTSRVTERQ